MKLPSIKYLTEEALKSAKKFPLTLLSALVGVFVAIYLIENEHEISDKLPLINLLLTSALGLVLFFCINIYHIKGQRTNLPLWVLNIIGGGILTVIYFSLPNANDTTNIAQPYIRYTIYNIVAHLMVSFAPFISKGEINGFWQYNKMLFLRLCLSILYSGFVYIGLTLAMVALNLLFDADIKGETFFELFIIVIGVFNTWFFVSGINLDLNSLENKTEYPKGLKVFTQYVLLPLLILYLTILYAYTAKIIGLWDWPKGIVSYLIVCVSVLGILSFLLIYPFGKNEEKHWISKFSKIYYYTLLPLTLVLFIAIGIRIDDYGLTVNRYLVLELGVWLAFISCYFIFGNKNIKVIPMSLAGLILFTSFGLWGMFSTSEKSQIKRLEDILINNNILVDGKVKNEPQLRLGKDSLYYLQDKNQNELFINDSLQNEVHSILNYLDDFHGFNAIDNWYTQNADSIFQVLKDSSKRYTFYSSEAKVRMELMGLGYRYNYTANNESLTFRAYNTKKYRWRIMKTTDYDYVITVNYYADNLPNREFNEVYQYGNDVFYFKENEKQVFSLIKESSDTLNFNIGKIIKGWETKYSDKRSIILEDDEMVIYDSSAHISAKFLLENVQTQKKDSTDIKSFMGKLFVKVY